MKCPYCAHLESKVVDSRLSSLGKAIRRRRECLACSRRFTTYEYAEESRLLVVKKDGRREPLDRKKILAGIMKACEKRPISMEKMEQLVDEVERALMSKYDREVSSGEIGSRVMDKLHQLDEVAYVRFASVYRQFKDLNQFMNELKELLDQRGSLKPPSKPGQAKMA